MKAIITGTTHGIGKATKEYLIEEGWEVFEPPVNLDLTSHFGRVAFCTESSEFCKNGLDLLMNNAGRLYLEEDLLTKAEQLAQLHILTTWYFCKYFECLLKERRGVIINVASVSGMKADPDCPFYAATKAAVISLSQSFAKKYAPDIRVNCISPGFVRTNLVPGELPKELFDTIPLGFYPGPEVIVKTVKFLLDNKYVTGANMVIDGGVSL